MSRQRADQLGIPYQLVFRGFQVAGCNADEMGIGPILRCAQTAPARRVEDDEIDIWELNEAFAVQVVYCFHHLVSIRRS